MATKTTIDVAPDPYDVDPAWDLDRSWSEAEYLKLDTNRLVEFVDGMIEVLPMPTLLHQLIVKYLLFQLDAYVSARELGTVLTAPFPVYTRKTRYREPDVLFLSKKTVTRIQPEDPSCDHADLVMEVVSDHDRRRDLHTKRWEYANARIPEYWIVDPRDEVITVLTLGANQKAYSIHGVFRMGERAASVLLPGFEVDVTEVFAQRSKINVHEFPPKAHGMTPMAANLTGVVPEQMLDPFYLDPDLGIDLDRSWTEREYLEFGAARGLEFVNGTIEVLPVPTFPHQMMLALLYKLLDRFVESRKLGMVLFAGLRVRTLALHYREPDLAFLRRESFDRMDHLYWDQADLVMEVVSDHDRRRDLHTKRREYAKARIPEYWIVDPRDEAITVLTLGANQTAYTVHGIFRRGERTTSVCLPGFEIDVTEVLDQRPDTLSQAT